MLSASVALFRFRLGRCPDRRAIASGRASLRASRGHTVTRIARTDFGELSRAEPRPPGQVICDCLGLYLRRHRRQSAGEMMDDPETDLKRRLRAAVSTASTRAEVREAVAAVYRDLAVEVEARRPLCVVSGR